ncbi:DNA repair protein XRCC1-like [Eriocheir sinensis]|uniref:DNA repair protein XRCC1-like n=1 Tax=Eriocheir sinensis TaxID=95602 RepID=UPI0021C9CBF0|nr:DNA repair protein XRCC1-like [Eriocheir sinensis]
MPLIKFTQVLSYSSEDPNHPADNLLRSDTFRKWKCTPNNSEKQSFVILKFEKLSSINSLDIGNDGSALIEVLVSREGMNDFQLLLVSSAFMSPTESRNGTDLHRVRMFGLDKLNKNVAEQKWDRLKVICTQPFNPKMQYGLSFITARSLESETHEPSPKVTQLGNFKLKMTDDSDPISVGSLFAKRKEKTLVNVTGPAAIRAASRESAAAIASAGVAKRKDQPSDRGSSPISKKPFTESVRSLVAKGPPPGTPTAHQSKDRKNETHSKPNSKPEKTEEKNKSKENGGREERVKKPDKIKNREKADKPSTSRTDTQETTRKRKSKPFTSLMDNVVFVMSGYQNPDRSTLRDKLVEMGAQYKSDWSPSCTHLICAFSNTPKYRQVKGKGKIVTGKWIMDCYKSKIRYPWRRYGLEKQKGGSESEEEIWAEEIMPKVSKPAPTAATPTEPSDNSDNEDRFSDNEDTDDEIQRVLNRQQNTAKGSEANPRKNYENSDRTKGTRESGRDSHPENISNSLTSNGVKDNSDDEVYEDDTDIDEELPDTSFLPLPVLQDYFQNKYFFLYGNMAEEKRTLLYRYITAFNGKIEDYMSEKVQFVISESKWDEQFEEALNDNPALQFVKAQWIWQCCDKKKLVPHQPYLIVP